jgi:hypothetical protein
MNIRFKRGSSGQLPTSAPSGTPLWVEGDNQLHIGTGTGIQLINTTSGEQTMGQTAIIQYQATTAPTIPTISKQTYPLNTVVLNEIAGLSLSSNRIYVPAGLYKYNISLNLDANCWLYNTSTSKMLTPIARTNTTIQDNEGIFYLQSAGYIQLDVYSSTIGTIVNFENNNVHAEVLLEKVR